MKNVILILMVCLFCSFSAEPEKTISISDLDLSLVELEMGQAQKNKTPMGSPIVVAGKTYDNGLGVSAPSVCLIELNGSGKKFTAEIGLCEMRRPGGANNTPAGAPDNTAAPAPPPGAAPAGAQPRRMPELTFFVLGDENILWQSAPVKNGDQPLKVEVDLTGIEKLALVVTSQGGGGPFGGGLAAWGDARISYTGDKNPVTIPNRAKSDGTKLVLTPEESPAPSINYPKVVGATPGKPFIFSIPVTGKKPLTVTVDHLPEGLKLDPVNGIISGTTPKAKGTYTLQIKAKNSYGEAKGQIDLKVGDQLALTPPMGWNSWNAGGMTVDQDKVKAAVDIFAEKLRGHGWSYINIDDGWQADSRTPEGLLLTNSKFSNIKGLSDYVHAKGLRFGIYSSPGTRTCGQALGSYEHEFQDAKTWAEWGIDYLKYDWCSYRSIAKDESLAELQKPYKLMRQALDQTNRDVLFSLCQYGMGDVEKWGAEVGGQTWRTTMDINDSWKSVLTTGFAQTDNAEYAGPGHWNDPDMLVIGSVGWNANTKPTRLSPDEQYAHITLWSLLASPLLIGCEMNKLDDFTLGLLTNDEVIGVNQDLLGRQATLVEKGDDYQIWAKELSDGSKAVGLFYMGESAANADPVKLVNWGGVKTDAPKVIKVDLKKLGINGKQEARNLWSRQSMGSYEESFTAEVNYHGAVLVKFSNAK